MAEGEKGRYFPESGSDLGQDVWLLNSATSSTSIVVDIV